MAAVLTVGTNSYADTTYADSYFANRLFADDWTTATTDQKAQALIMAARTIDRLILIGSKLSSEQIMQFPRRYPFQVHDIWRKWFQTSITDEFETLYVEGASWYADMATPDLVLQAQCEEALAILMYYNSNRAQMQRQGVELVMIGRTREQYRTGYGKGLLSVEAKEIMRPWIAGAVSII